MPFSNSFIRWSHLLKEKIHNAPPLTKGRYRQMENDDRHYSIKDLDKIIHSASFRRLQDKAQVFPLERKDYARTRLTHSLEVEMTCESLGEFVKDLVIERIKLNEDVVEKLSDDNKRRYEKTYNNVMNIPNILRAAGLLHDMGNPPFGHIAESIIQDWFSNNLKKIQIDQVKVEGKITANIKVSISDASHNSITTMYDHLTEDMKKDLLNFEGNAQLLRIISKMNYVKDEYSMNLSYPSMATTIKYPRSSNESKDPKKKLSHKKIGYYSSEKELFIDINKTLKLNNKRHLLTYILEASDDIAYLSSDIEDAVKKEVLNVSQVISAISSDGKSTEYLNKEKEELKIIYDEIYKKRNVYQCYEDFYDKNIETIHNICKETELYIEDSNNYPSLRKETYVIQRFRVFMRGYLVSSIKSAIKQNFDLLEDSSLEYDILEISIASILQRRIRKFIEIEYIYYCKEIIYNKIHAENIIRELIENLLLSVFNNKNLGKNDDKNSLIYNLISDNYRLACDNANKSLEPYSSEWCFHKILLVTDFICGMTDTYAVDLYNIIKSHSP